MPMFDLGCSACAWERPDTFVIRESELPICPNCGAATAKVWRKGAFPGLVDDSIPGGETIENLAPTPQTFYSRSEKRLWLKMHGVREQVRHVGVQGSDKSPHTSRWV